MRKIICLNVLLWAFPLFGAEVVDRIVAIVNQDVVTQFDLDRAMIVAKGQPRERVLEELINKKLLDQEISKAKIEVEEEEMARAIADVLRQNQTSIEALRADLGRKGISFESFKEELSKEIQQVKFIQQTLGSGVQVSAKEVESYKSEQKKDSPFDQQVKVSWIFLPINSKHDDAKDVQKILQKGYKIVEKSRRGEKIKGFSLGEGEWRSLTDAPPVVASHVKTMEAVSVSDPLVTPQGIYIVKLFEKNEPFAEKKEVATAEDWQIHQSIYNERMDQTLQNYFLKLRRKSYIEIR